MTTSPTPRRARRVDARRSRRSPPESVADATGRRCRRRSAASPARSPQRRRQRCTDASARRPPSSASTASWLIDVVNILSGNLDRPGGAMFPTPVAGGATTRGKPGSGRGFSVGRGHSRVSGHPEVMGEYPVGVLAEEIETPGRRTDPGAGDARRQPGAVDAQQRAARRGARRTRLHGQRRHLPQRDHPPRRRDPAAAVAAAARPLRPAAAAVRRAQRRQLLASPSCRSTTASPTSGRSSPSSRPSRQGLGTDVDAVGRRRCRASTGSSAAP